MTEQMELKFAGDWATDEEWGTRFRGGVNVVLAGREYGVGEITVYEKPRVDQFGIRREAGEAVVECCDRNYPDTDEYMRAACGTDDPRADEWIVHQAQLELSMQDFARDNGLSL